MCDPVGRRCRSLLLFAAVAALLSSRYVYCQSVLDACYVKGTVRYYITVKGTDYVFVWPGYSVAYCGR
jgi:hypothetical protein